MALTAGELGHRLADVTIYLFIGLLVWGISRITAGKDANGWTVTTKTIFAILLAIIAFVTTVLIFEDFIIATLVFVAVFSIFVFVFKIERKKVK